MTVSQACEDSVLGHRKGWKAVEKHKPALNSLGPIYFHRDQAD